MNIHEGLNSMLATTNDTWGERESIILKIINFRNSNLKTCSMPTK